MLIDSHCHPYYWELKWKEEATVSEFLQHWVSKIVSVWIDLETSQKSVELAKKHPWIIYACVWIHPVDAKKFNLEKSKEKLIKIVEENRDFIVCIGETGYDSHWDKIRENEQAYEIQKSFFEMQIEVAKMFDLPLMIHNRESWDLVLETLKVNNFDNFIIHCFSEDINFAEKCFEISEKCVMSFSWIVTYKSAKNIQETVQKIPLNRIIIETDAPFLAPVPHRWEINSPSLIKHTFRKIVELREESEEEIKNQIYKNTLKTFNIKN